MSSNSLHFVENAFEVCERWGAELDKPPPSGSQIIGESADLYYTHIMNMFKQVKATTVKEYFDMLPPERRESMDFLHTFIQKVAPTLKPHFAYNMLGYGSFKYKNYKKEIIDWPTVALASQKNYISLYVCAVVNGEYVAEKHKSELGKVSVGKSCIRFKKIDDLNLKALEKVIRMAEKSPGLVGAGEHK